MGNNLTWFDGFVTRADRECLRGHKAFVLWFTGLSASGKSTIAHHTEKLLHLKGLATYVFDGDNVRHGLCSDLGFSDADRKENIRRIGEMIKLFVDANVITLTSFISPFKADRDRIRALFPEGEFLEVYVSCPVDVCAARDKKGLYAKARAGLIENFTGISSPYEPPENAEIVVHSNLDGPMDAAKKIMAYLEASGRLSALAGEMLQEMPRR